MNYEALGRYTHAVQQRQDAQRKLSIYATAVRDLAFSMSGYNPPYKGKDSLLEQIAIVAALLPEITELQKGIVALGNEIAALRSEYNLPA